MQLAQRLGRGDSVEQRDADELALRDEVDEVLARRALGIDDGG